MFWVTVAPLKFITGVPVKLSFTNWEILVLPVNECDSLYVWTPFPKPDLDILDLKPLYNPGAYILLAALTASPVLSKL